MHTTSIPNRLRPAGCILLATALIGLSSLQAQILVGTLNDLPGTGGIAGITPYGNNFFITDGIDDDVFEMDASGVATGFSFSLSGWLYSDLETVGNSLWGPNYYGHWIDEWSTSGTYLGSFNPSPHVTEPLGIAYNPNTGNLYVTENILGGPVHEFTTSGTYVGAHPLPSHIQPFTLTFDPLRENYWVNDQTAQIVYQLDSNFAELMSFSFGQPVAFGVAVAGDLLYIALLATDQVLIFSLPEIAEEAEEVAPPSPAPSAPTPHVDINTPAIQSLYNSGLFMAYANQSAALNASNSVNHDLNDRLLRLRGMLLSENSEAGTASHQPSNSQVLSRVLAMSAGMNMDHRVALGLREGVDTTFHSERSLWMGSPMGMMGGQMSMPDQEVHAVVAAPAGAKNPVGKDVITESNYSRLQVYTAGDFNAYSQDQLNQRLQQFDTDTYAGTVGLEYRLLPWLMAGAGWSYVTSDTNLDHNLGGIDLDGQIISTYLSGVWNQFYADAKYSYGGFDHETNRNTLMGGTAHGDTNSWVHNMALNLGYNIPVRRNFVMGPIANLDYSTGGVSGYSETGGGAANVAYSGEDVESMISQLGWQATVQHQLPKARLLAQLHAGWEHEFMPQSDTITASLVNSPFVLVNGASRTPFGSFDGSLDSAHAGTDWLALGAAVRLNFNSGWNTSLNYETQLFRSDATNHHVGLKVSRDF